MLLAARVRYFLIWGLLWPATALHLGRRRFVAGPVFGGGR